MTLSVRGSDRHANQVHDAVRNGVHELGNDMILRSWSRCLNEYQLHADRPHQPPVITNAALQARLIRWADVIDCARYEMTTLYQQLGDLESAVVLTDADGVIVHMVSSPEFEAEVAPMGMRTGGIWSEPEAGTNGMGTCLASACPVTIRREDHFFSQFSNLTCSAVPVFDPSGEIAAVLDVTSRSSLMQQHLLVLLGMTARMIETASSMRAFATLTRCTFTAARNSFTRCTKASSRSITTGACWPPTAVRCSSSACSRWTRFARAASKSCSRARSKTCCNAVPRRRSIRS